MLHKRVKEIIGRGAGMRQTMTALFSYIHESMPCVFGFTRQGYVLNSTISLTILISVTILSELFFFPLLNSCVMSIVIEVLLIPLLTFPDNTDGGH